MSTGALTVGGIPWDVPTDILGNMLEKLMATMTGTTMDSVTSGLERRGFGEPWATAAIRTILTNAPRSLAANEAARGNKITVLRDKRRTGRKDAAVRPVP